MSVPDKLFSNPLYDGLSKKFILLKIQLPKNAKVGQDGIQVNL